MVAASIVPASPARAAFADQQCPEASQYVSAIALLRPDDPPQKVYEATRAATNAYETCSTRQLADGNVEPAVHYAYVRRASFGVVEARALLALNRRSEAKTVLETSKRLAAEVVDWRQNMSFGGSSKDNRASLYHDSAKDVLDAANAMLAKLEAPAPAGPAVSAPPRSSPSR